MRSIMIRMFGIGLVWGILGIDLAARAAEPGPGERYASLSSTSTPTEGQPQATTPEPLPFRELWRREFPDWAYFMVIREGVVYATCLSGTLSALDLYTGELLREASGVAFATAPLIVGDRIYSYRVGGQLYELDLGSFQRLRTITVSGGGYTESIPYDPETGFFFIWRWLGNEEARFSAVSLETGRDAWITPSLGPRVSNSTSPILPGDDSIYVQAADGVNRLYRLDKATGVVRWTAALSPGDRADYNNMVYDRARDCFYVSTVDAHCFAVRRTDGAVLWSHHSPGHEIHATLSYHGGRVYLPLMRMAIPHGACAALDADDGKPLWVTDGFFGEDGWSAMAVDDRYLYRNTHNDEGRIIVQDRFTGDLVWSGDAGAPQPCTNPVQSDGIVLFGNSRYVLALQAGTGLPVDCGWHGLYNTGYNPGAILWDTSRPNEDLDTDALPDLWEISEFGHLFADGSADSDGDDSSNYEEYVAGTSCAAASDHLTLRCTLTGEHPSLEFESRVVSGLPYQGQRRFYAVESKPAAGDQEWQPLPGAGRLPATGAVRTLSLAAHPPNQFYRVRVWLEP